jgi:hypothetical protein
MDETVRVLPTIEQRLGSRNNARHVRPRGHTTRQFEALRVDPAIVFGKQRRDHRADVVGFAQFV